MTTTHYVRVENGRVTGGGSCPDDLDPVDVFGEGDWHAAPASVTSGWVLEGHDFAPPPVPPPTEADLVAYANARQWALATGGFVVTIKGAPIPFATTETALGLMDGKVMRLAQPNPPATVHWQVGPSAFAAIGADDFVRAAILVSDFVQATFDALPALFAAIAAGTITSPAEIDAAAWPAPAGAVA